MKSEKNNNKRKLNIEQKGKRRSELIGKLGYHGATAYTYKSEKI